MQGNQIKQQGRVSTKVNGKTIDNMGKVLRSGKMEATTKGSFLVVRKVEEAVRFGMTVQSSSESGNAT